MRRSPDLRGRASSRPERRWRRGGGFRSGDNLLDAFGGAAPGIGRFFAACFVVPDVFAVLACFAVLVFFAACFVVPDFFAVLAGFEVPDFLVPDVFALPAFAFAGLVVAFFVAVPLAPVVRVREENEPVPFLPAPFFPVPFFVVGVAREVGLAFGFACDDEPADLAAELERRRLGVDPEEVEAISRQYLCDPWPMGALPQSGDSVPVG